MEEIIVLRETLSSEKEKDVPQIRLALANLIAKCLSEKRESLGYWEKTCLASSICWLSRNVHTSGQYDQWLRICLVEVEKACTPSDQRSEELTEKDPKIESLTYDQLMDDVRKLGGDT